MLDYYRVFRDISDEYIEACQKSNTIPSCDDVISDILALMETKISAINACSIKEKKMKFPQALPPFIIARLIKGINHGMVINRTTTFQADRDGKQGMYLAAYEDDVNSARYGLYSTDKIETLANAYNPGLKKSEIIEVMEQLKILCKNDVHELTRDKNLVAVHNGIFNLKTMQLMDFSSDYVFLTKSRADYNPNATQSPVIQNPDGTTWELDTWIRNLANNEPELEQLMWEIIAAVLRNQHSFDKAALFYSPHGANGKGTFSEMLKSLVASATINLGRLSEKYGLTSLNSPVAMIISDENSTELQIKDASIFKCLVTHDPVVVELKYMSPYEMTFDGLVVQCINKLPRINDISASLLRRMMIVPFKQQYLGKENRLIKEDYVHRPEVLEYALHKALEMDFDAFNVPAQCELLLEEFVEVNNPVYSFFNEVESKLKWDFIPNRFLYDLYVKWMQQNMPMEKPYGRNIFLNELRNILSKFDKWKIAPNGTSTQKYTFDCEPLILEFDLIEKWGDPRWGNTLRGCIPLKGLISSTAGGILRLQPRIATRNPFHANIH